MGRDHSAECETCGEMRGGFDDLLCDCFIEEDLDRMRTGEQLRTLAHNLAWAASLCRAWQQTLRNSVDWQRGCAVLWRPGCGRSAP